MSANKANQISEAPPSIQASNLFNSSHTNPKLSEFSEQHYQKPCELFSLQAKKYNNIIFNNHSSETISEAPIKWMSSKMRLMRKMMSQEQITENKSRENIESMLNRVNKASGTVIRVCSICNTTKTPLWRSGPQGPKSLCNACGIRQMKARRAAAAGVTSTAQDKTMTIKREKKFDVDRAIPYKKRYKFGSNGVDHERKKLRESSSAIFHSAFPQEEEDAAILLMTLSFG